MDGSDTTASSAWRARSFALGVDAPALLSGGLSLLLLVSFWLTPYLPMVDLPQHAAQISIWLHEHDPSFAEPGRFVLNFRTPYLGAYFAARVLASALGVLSALKLVVWLSLVGHLAAFSLLTRKLGYPRWLGALGLPLGMGYGFFFGFISFIAAVPFGLLAIYAALCHREAPSLRRGLLLAAALCATLGMHGFLLGMALAVVGPLLLRGSGRFLARLLPLVAPAVLALIWLVPGSSGRSIGYTIWDPRLLDLAQAPALLVGVSAVDHAASLFGVLFLTLTALTLGRPRSAPEFFLPLSLMLLGYCLFPLMLGGFGPLHPRFVAFFVPCLLLAFRPRERPLFVVLPYLAFAGCALWFGLFATRLLKFKVETQPVVDFIAQMPRALSIRPIVFERAVDAFPGLPARLHLPAYYAAEKGGRQGYSFAMYPTSVVRYAPGVIPTMDGGSEWHPEYFSAAAELDAYACFLVQSESDRRLEIFRERTDEVRLAFHEADWWAYVTPSFDAFTGTNGNPSPHD